jgi:hypothetical protein
MARSARRHHRRGAAAQRRLRGLLASDVAHARGLQPAVRFQAVGVDGRARGHMVPDEREHGRLCEVGNDAHAKAIRGLAPFLHRDQHDRGFSSFQLATAPNARLLAADPGIVDFHVAVQRLARGVDHRPSQLVQQHPRRFVSPQAQLALEQQGRDATLVGHGQIRRPEPHRQGSLRVVKDRARRQRDLATARHALPAATRRQTIRLAMAAPRTHESVRPATRRQVFLARGLGRELTLKLSQIPRKTGAWHAPTLHMVPC